MEKKIPARFLTLDYLRGSFIVLIIVDHLWRWPNIYQYMSGRGELWASAAEGFVIISGLLVGYVRGHKNRHESMKVVSKKLIRRGIMLYLWAIITTLLLAGATWLLPSRGSFAYIPYNQFDWVSLLTGAITLHYTHTLTHFLYLYAVYLVVSPLVIWLLRKGKTWLVILCSILLWWVGYVHGIELLQWQILFFISAAVGFSLDPLMARLHYLSQSWRYMLIGGTLITSLATIIWSARTTLLQSPGSGYSEYFSRDPLSLSSISISFMWFLGLVAFFSLLQPIIGRWLGWLLLPLGTRSLTAYILHSVPMVACSVFLPDNLGSVANTLLATICILVTWGMLKIPYINHIIPR